MKVEFTIRLQGSGPNAVKAYQDMRRKLLPLKDWADTDEACELRPDGSRHWLGEEEVQVARRAFPSSKDGKRKCRMGPVGCLHDVVVYGIPACMMDAKEARKMTRRGQDMVSLNRKLKDEEAK